jgi:hypothetical protein
MVSTVYCQDYIIINNEDKKLGAQVYDVDDGRLNA